MSNKPPILGLLALLAMAESLRAVESAVPDSTQGPHGPGCRCAHEDEMMRPAFRIIEGAVQTLLIRMLDEKTGQPIIKIAIVDPDDRGASIYIEAKYNDVETRDVEFQKADVDFVLHALQKIEEKLPF